MMSTSPAKSLRTVLFFLEHGGGACGAQRIQAHGVIRQVFFQLFFFSVFVS